MSKVFKTKKELLDHLVNDRKIAVPTDFYDVFDFARYNNLIDAYKDIVSLEKSRGVYFYSSATSINDFINLHRIDEFVSLKLFSFIDGYENALKLFVSNRICESMVKAGSSDCCDYSLFKLEVGAVDLKLDCFISPSYMFSNNPNSKLVFADEKNSQNRDRVFDKIDKLASGLSKGELNYYSKDFFTSKGYLPFYILIGNLSFSNLITLFELFTEEIQLDFMRNVLKMDVVNFSDIKSLSTKHNIMRILRNATHHHEPVIPFLVKKEYLDFSSKKSSVELIKRVSEHNRYKAKIDFACKYDIEIIKTYKSKQSKKLIQILEIIN